MLTRKLLVLNLQTCNRCSGGPKSPGEIVLCPISGEPILGHAMSGECGKGLLRKSLTQVTVPRCLPTPAAGPGTELKKLLARFGIKATPECDCTSMAAKMDREGPLWCLDHADEILKVMREEAEKRGSPWIELAGRTMIRKAVRTARKKAKSG